MVFGEGCNISPTPKISPSLKWLSNPKMHRTIILQNANRACCCNPCVTKTFRTAPIGAQLIPRCSPPLLPAVSGGSWLFPLQCSERRRELRRVTEVQSGAAPKALGTTTPQKHTHCTPHNTTIEWIPGFYHHFNSVHTGVS